MLFGSRRNHRHSRCQPCRMRRRRQLHAHRGVGRRQHVRFRSARTGHWACLQEWYLFPDQLDTSVNKNDFSNLAGLSRRAGRSGARGRSKDRFFTYITSIEEETDLIENGSNAGFGVRLVYDTMNNRVFIAEAFENAPAFAAGIDRGTELLQIDGRRVARLMASDGDRAPSVDALGPSEPGITRTSDVPDHSTARTVDRDSVTKEEYPLDPVSDRYGVKILDDGAGGRVGYINLRTFIVSTADRQLADAFELFADEGLTNFVIDLRYNGGGLVRIAELMGDLMRNGNTGEVFSRLVLRDSKSSENETRLFRNTAQFFNPSTGSLGAAESIPAVDPVKLAFITTRSSASASELIINSMLPYVAPENIALIGGNTFGKPVGQFAFDRSQCDDRLRAVAFKTVNANNQGEYFDGLASVVPNTCRANDDIFTQLGDPAEDFGRRGARLHHRRQLHRVQRTAIQQDGCTGRSHRGPATGTAEHGAARYSGPFLNAADR